MKKQISIILFSSLLFGFHIPAFGDEEYIDISDFFDFAKYGVEANPAEIIETNEFVFVITKDTDVRVKHVINQGTWAMDAPKLIKTLPGEHSNLEVWDEDEDFLPKGFVGQTFEESEYVIAGQKPSLRYDLLVEYDLKNFLEFKDGMWKKEISFSQDVVLLFDDEIDLVFINSRPIDLSKANGINCFGCNAVVEFFDGAKPEIKKVYKPETKIDELTNIGQEFSLEFFSDGEINNLNYLHELDYLAFNVNRDNQLVSVKIPLNLLLTPYHVYLTEKDQEILVEGDKIRKTEFSQTETHANVSFRAATEGVIHIVGSSEMEHQKLLSSLDVKEPTEEVPQSLQENMQPKEENVSNKAELFEQWEQTNPSSEDIGDYTIIYAIIGIIIAIIVGVIIKLKKN